VITPDEITAAGYDFFRILDDGTYLSVSDMSFGKGRLILFDNIWGYERGWFYTNFNEAIHEMNRWNPEDEEKPQGWMREIHTGLRRPDGDASKEYHNW